MTAVIGTCLHGEKNDEQRSLVANRRTTTRELEIQGRTIPKGYAVTLMWIAANRDPRVFDNPDVAGTGCSDIVAFAEALIEHARTEEEVMYPAALLVGQLVRQRMSGHLPAAA